MSAVVQKPQPEEVKSMAAKIANDNKARAPKPVLQEVAKEQPQAKKLANKLEKGPENGKDSGLNANKPDGRER